jgi:hypothetical protein
MGVGWGLQVEQAGNAGHDPFHVKPRDPHRAPRGAYALVQDRMALTGVVTGPGRGTLAYREPGTVLTVP